MKRFRNLPIGTKLQMINLLATTVAGLVLAVVLTALLYMTVQHSYQEKVKAISALLSDNISPALLFGDSQSAQETLATLRAVPDVAYAEVFDGSGRSFAHYGEPDGVPAKRVFVPANYPPGFHLGSQVLNQVVPIVNHAANDEQIGNVVIQMNLLPAYTQLLLDAGVLFVLLLLSFMLNSKLLGLFQGTITKPLFDLAGVMHKVSQEGDFSVRAMPASTDEIGDLASSFNQMLNELSKRDSSLLQELRERQRVEHQLLDSNRRFETVLRALPDLMFEVDAAGTYLNVWGGRLDLLAAPRDELIGKTIAEKLPPDAADVCMQAIAQADRNGFSQGRQISLLLPLGEVKWFELSIAKQTADGAEGARFVVLSRDITERKKSEERIEQLAFYDPLTGLPNRRLLTDRLKQALASSMRNGKEGALLFIDLDNFKTLNDTFGHDMGDQLLKQVAQRITSCLRECDTVARLGGDEFVVILENLSEDVIKAAALIESIGRKILSALDQPYVLGTHEYSGTPSIGATLFSDHQQDIDELLKQADIAMYQAKSDGRNTLRFFDPKMQDTVNERAVLEEELHRALVNKEFHLYYQIQVDHSGRPVGAESLIRWIHPQRGRIEPGHFIPLIEETGLIVPIGQWVIEQACAQLRQWQQRPVTQHLVLAVNVSAKQFHQADFVAHVQAAVAQNGINPNHIKLELTESMLLRDVEAVIATMTALKNIGVRFSLDDFGTGYSSLQYLKQLPLDQLKIDQSFVRELAHNQSDKAIVRTIIAMAEGLNLDVIAEGVETVEQREFLLNNGCKQYQGYLFSKPVPIAEFEALLQ